MEENQTREPISGISFRDRIGKTFLNSKAVTGVYLLTSICLTILLQGIGLILTLLMIWLYVWATRCGGRGIGFTRPKSIVQTILLGFLLGAVIHFFTEIILTPLTKSFVGEIPDVTAFDSIRGNIGVTLIYIAIGWVIGGFSEEIIYRGFFMKQFADRLFKGSAAGWITALIISSALFGFAHMYQGTSGIILTGTIGLLLGLIFMKSRNLWLNIVIHGTIDMIAFITMYLNIDMQIQNLVF